MEIPIQAKVEKVENAEAIEPDLILLPGEGFARSGNAEGSYMPFDPFNFAQFHGASRGCTWVVM